MHKWGLILSANCRSGAEKQTASHIPASCPLYHPPNVTLGLAALDDYNVTSLKQLHLTSVDTIGPNEEEEEGALVCYSIMTLFSLQTSTNAMIQLIHVLATLLALTQLVLMSVSVQVKNESCEVTLSLQILIIIKKLR